MLKQSHTAYVSNKPANSKFLRIPDTYEAKIVKIQTHPFSNFTAKFFFPATGYAALLNKRPTSGYI